MRFSNVADKLADSILDRRHLVTITNDFGAAHDILEPRHVYFLSKDLLSKNGLLIKVVSPTPAACSGTSLTAPSGIRRRNLYLFIDEAHRGLGANASSERGTATIYASLI